MSHNCLTKRNNLLVRAMATEVARNFKDMLHIKKILQFMKYINIYTVTYESHIL